MTSTLAPAPSIARAGFGALGLAAAGGLLVGVVTAYAQGQLPADLSSVANSCGPWVVAAFLLALFSPRVSVAALSGAVSLAGMTWGYYAADLYRGFPASTAHVLFWLAAAVAIGPVAGASAAWLRFRTPWLAALGVGGLAGLCVGEGRYGLGYLLTSTSPVFWKLEIAAGALLLVLGALRIRRLPDLAVALVAAAAVAIVFPMVYANIL